MDKHLKDAMNLANRLSADLRGQGRAKHRMTITDRVGGTLHNTVGATTQVAPLILKETAKLTVLATLSMLTIASAAFNGATGNEPQKKPTKRLRRR